MIKKIISFGWWQLILDYIVPTVLKLGFIFQYFHTWLIFQAFLGKKGVFQYKSLPRPQLWTLLFKRDLKYFNELYQAGTWILKTEIRWWCGTTVMLQLHVLYGTDPLSAQSNINYSDSNITLEEVMKRKIYISLLGNGSY